MRQLLGVGLLCVLSGSCRGASTEPRDTTLRAGRWSGDNACLAVTSDACDLVVGCGHGQFSQPSIHPDGSFLVAGTYRIEVGPIGITPAPPAVFSGILSGRAVTITVTPSDSAIRPVTSALQFTNQSGRCAVPCL